MIEDGKETVQVTIVYAAELGLLVLKRSSHKTLQVSRVMASHKEQVSLSQSQ